MERDRSLRKFKAGHDSLLEFNLTWTHRFNETETFFDDDGGLLHLSVARPGRWNRSFWTAARMVSRGWSRSTDQGERSCDRVP
jgi:hypothetical protein